VVYIIIGLFVYLAASRKKLKIIFSENGYRFIWLSVLPVVLLHFIFLQYSVQDFTALYASLFFSVLLGILYDKVKKSDAVPVTTLRIGLFVTVAVLVAQFYAMNYRDDVYFYRTAGQEIITKNSTKEDVIFWPTNDIDPQLVFYAQRNIRYAKTPEEAKAFLRSTGNKQGVMFFVKPRGFTIQKITAD
jgi:hypothetical protein